MRFESLTPDAQNCQIVRSLNAILRLEENSLAKVLRDRTIALQGTPFANTGLAFQEAIKFLESRTALEEKK